MIYKKFMARQAFIKPSFFRVASGALLFCGSMTIGTFSLTYSLSAHAQFTKTMPMPGHSTPSKNPSSNDNQNNNSTQSNSNNTVIGSSNTIEVQSGQQEISLSASPETLAKTKDGIAKAQAAYEAELAACDKLTHEEDKYSCQKEARAAEQMKREGAELNNYQNPQQLERNALARCDKLTGQDKASCQARMIGYGTQSGSVEGGGIIREINTKYQAGRGAITVLPLNQK